MPPKTKKKTGAQLERMLLESIPQTPIPQPYFNIPSPDPYRFPLSETLLEGIKLLQKHFPNDINQKIKAKLNCRIERMSRFRDTYCMVGKGGNGLLIGEKLMKLKGISAYVYGPNYLIIAYEDLTLEVYDLNLQLIKALKNFTNRKITFVKILNTPKAYESIIILCNTANKVSIHRIEKSFFSKLSCNFGQDVLKNLQFPVTQMTQIPSVFKIYLRKDPSYQSCSLICISAINKVFIVRINHLRLSSDKFWDVVFTKQYNEPTTNSVSWGQGSINSPSFEMKGERLILTYSFGELLYFLAFREVEKHMDGQVVTRCEWVESKPFVVREGKVAFCQYMKKSQILIVTEDNTVIIFNTKSFQIFENQIMSDEIQTLVQNNPQHLQGRTVQLIPGKIPDHLIDQNITQQQRQMLGQIPLVTFADSFSYEYPSNQIFFLTQQCFGIYLYCKWKDIANMLKVEQRYECAMLFLIAMYKKANRFDLGLDGSEKELTEFIQVLATDFINNKVSKIKQMPQIIKNLTQNQEFFKMIIVPIELLTQTEEFTFLFEVAKDKIISALSVSNDPFHYSQATDIFFQALTKFIEHGRIKFIPQSQMQLVLDYYIDKDRQDMVDRLAIYFDLTKIDRNIVIQCLLQQNLVVSLAHVCTQGNQSQFITPFVKFWGQSENFRKNGEMGYAAASAFRALWYVKLCLQRNWVLKQYTLEKYARMISVLSQHFLTERMLTGLLQICPQQCLDTLTYYFTIQNGGIVNEMQELSLAGIEKLQMIEARQYNQKLEMVLSAISVFTNKSKTPKSQIMFNLFLCNIIVYKTVKFNKQKYGQILKKLIDNHDMIKEVKFGLQDKKIEEYKQEFSQYPWEQIEAILQARYIIRILTLIYYEASDYIRQNLQQIYWQAKQYDLTDLQAQLAFMMGNYQNSIDLYVRARPSARYLVFQFLQSSFKKLILQKKNNLKKNLADCITQQIKWLVSLDPSKTKVIIDVYIPELQEDLIAALEDDQQLQLGYLEDIINDEGYNQRKRKLSDKTIIRFVQLMAKMKPDSLIEVFKKNTYLSIEESLKICEQYKVYDCMEYLYQRMGSINQSVKIAALRIDQILLNRAQYEDYEAPYIKIKDILDNAIDVCKKNHSEEVWQALLDSSIALYEKYRESDLPEDQIQIFFYINGEIMENLASNCPLQHTIELIQTKYQNLNMGGKMTKAFTNILSNLSHSINILYISKNLVHHSLQTFMVKEYESKLQCFHTKTECDTCGFLLQRRKDSIHFKCGHAYHKQCIVSQDSFICVCCLMNQSDQFTYYLNTINPQNPKIKKINELFEKFTAKKFQMSEVFKIQEYEQSRVKQQNLMIKRVQSKKTKFQLFDQNVLEVENGNRRVLKELTN